MESHEMSRDANNRLFNSFNAKRRQGQSSKHLREDQQNAGAVEDAEVSPDTPLQPKSIHDPFRPNHIVAPGSIPHGGFLNTLRSWWLECLTCLLVFLVLMALILTVYYQQGKPLVKYSLGITINTLISIYSIILKTACVFIVTEGKQVPFEVEFNSCHLIC